MDLFFDKVAYIERRMLDEWKWIYKGIGKNLGDSWWGNLIWNKKSNCLLIQ